MALPTSETLNASWSWLGDDNFSYPDGVNVANAVQTSASPVAVINGKLLTGSGLSAFQDKFNHSHSWTAPTNKSFRPSISRRPFGVESLQIPPYGMSLGPGADQVHIYDPSGSYGMPMVMQ
jgi:hypothetical protein